MKLLAALALALGLFAGLVAAPSPANAHQFPPGQWYQATDACTHRSIYGDFGSNGFAQMQLVTSGCNIYSQIEVVTTYFGQEWHQPCSVGAAIFNPTTACTTVPGSPYTTIQATIHGTALEMNTATCGGVCTNRYHWAL